MKTRVLIIIGIIVGVSILSVSLINYEISSKPNIPQYIDGFTIWDVNAKENKFYPIDKLDEMPCDEYGQIWDEGFRTFVQSEILVQKLNSCSEDNSIDGFGIEDGKGNVIHYFIDNLDEMPCRDFIHVWQEVFRTVEEHEILVNKYDICFDETFGGLGNRHPAFLGWYIPDICTHDMVKFLKKNSNMFDNNVPYSSPLDGDVLDPGVNPDDMVQCENELLENRDNEPSWPGR